MVARRKGPAQADRGGSTEEEFIKMSDALADADYKKCLKLVDGGSCRLCP